MYVLLLHVWKLFDLLAFADALLLAVLLRLYEDRADLIVTS